MTRISLFLLRRKFLSRFRPLMHSSRSITSLPLSMQNLFTDTPEPFLISFNYAIWSKTRKRFRLLRWFLTPSFSQQKISSTSLYLCSSLLWALSTTTQGKIEEVGDRGCDAEKCLLLRAERYFSLAEILFSNKVVMGENGLNSTPRKRSIHLKRDRSYTREVKIISLDDPEVALPPKETAWTEKSTRKS